MTDEQNMRIAILSNQFVAKNKDGNPYIRAGKVFEWWYSKNPRDTEIPKEMLPSKECFQAWDEAEAHYIASHLKDYNTLLAYWQESLGKPIEDIITRTVARTRPCECREAQCNFFCPEYNKEGKVCGLYG